MTSPNSFYPPYSNQEDILNDDHDDLQDFAPSQLFEETGTSGSYMYPPHAPDFHNPFAGSAPPNSYSMDFCQLPFHHRTMDPCYPDQSPLDPLLVMPGSAPQEQFHLQYIGSQPFTEPLAMPATPMELPDFMMLDPRSGLQCSPRATSYTSGPSTPSSLNTSGVALYSHSPTSPQNRTSQSPGFTGPDSVIGTGSRQSPISPSQKRSLGSSADDSLPGRRVIPRHAGSSNVHSATPRGTDTITTSSITSRVPGRGPTIPQTLYNVGSTHAFHLSLSYGMTVTFDVAGETGIPLHQLLARQSFLLQERDERISDMSGDTASIRIEWPGYTSFTKQIASKDWKKTRSPNTRERLAMKVAGAINTFFQKYANTTCEPPNSTWRIGANGIRVEDLVLVSLHRVSQGSWQPKLCLLHDNAQQ